MTASRSKHVSGVQTTYYRYKRHRPGPDVTDNYVLTNTFTNTRLIILSISWFPALRFFLAPCLMLTFLARLSIGRDTVRRLVAMAHARVH